MQCGECILRPPPLDICLAALDYTWPWPDCIAQFKFNGETGWAATFAQLLARAPGIAPALAACAYVVPMPLAPARLRERGFNQALELARALAPAKVDATLLRRTRETPAQSGLARAKRLSNVRDAFAIDPARSAAIAGRSIVLIDDVMTSGASLFAAAEALRAAGAAPLVAIVLARTPSPD